MQQTNQNLIKITKLLSDCQYHDGTSIGKELGITRAAVWKAIKKLSDLGVAINSVKGRGYCLFEPIGLLEEEEITQYLNNKQVTIDVLEKVGSTNSYLSHAVPDKQVPHVCIAEMQTQGRGRFGRDWHSPFGKNIYFSLYYPFQKDISELPGLSLVVGLAVCRALNSVCKMKEAIGVKWPNDIWVNKQKLAGNLIEIKSEANGSCQAIIGIGINVNMTQAKNSAITQSWASLKTLTNEYQDRNRLCAELANSLFNYLIKFSEVGLSGFLDEWNAQDCLMDEAIELDSNGKKYRGIGAGVNSQGQLQIRLDDGCVQVFSSGDTHLVK